MTYENAINIIERAIDNIIRPTYPLMYVEAFYVAIDALKAQADIVRCRDCTNWAKAHKIFGLDTKTAIDIGECSRTEIICGGNGYCMFGNRKGR